MCTCPELIPLTGTLTEPEAGTKAAPFSTLFCEMPTYEPACALTWKEVAPAGIVEAWLTVLGVGFTR